MDIINNDHLSRFEAPVAGGTGVLRYRIEPPTIFLLHVEVPIEAQGRGVAAELTKAALEFARANGWKVVPVCSYVAAYIRRNPEYGEMPRK